MDRHQSLRRTGRARLRGRRGRVHHALHGRRHAACHPVPDRLRRVKRRRRQHAHAHGVYHAPADAGGRAEPDSGLPRRLSERHGRLPHPDGGARAPERVQCAELQRGHGGRHGRLLFQHHACLPAHRGL